jgi:ABC-2 type transport system ATP-binding protein
MIRVKDLSKDYGEVQAVKSINFEIPRGQIVGFLGANGAGKTTTLQMITGYLIPTGGIVEVDDLNISDHAEEIQKRIGYLPELNPLYGEMIVHDYLSFIADIRGIRGREFREALHRIVDQCGLKSIVHRQISECSKGYRQRIGLAASMIHDPDILILDEPVTGLDPNQIVEIRELIKNLGKKKLVLMSSHILQEIQATVDRIIIIHEGEIVADGTNEELMSSFMGNVLLTMETNLSQDDQIKEMSDSVPAIKIVSSDSIPNGHKIHLEYKREEDPREQIFKYAVNKGWVILSMTPHTANLEDIFRNLTVTGGNDA